MPCCGAPSPSSCSPTRHPAGSLPRRPARSLKNRGGVRNWDYRFCWLRDAAFTIRADALLGYTARPTAWHWLATHPRQPGGAETYRSCTASRRARLTEVRARLASRVRGRARARRQRGRPSSSSSTCTARSRRPHPVPRSAASSTHARRRFAVGARTSITAHWPEPDDGIWEVRGRATALHAVEGHGLGRLGARRQDRSRGVDPAPDRATDASSPTRSGRGPLTRLQQAIGVHPSRLGPPRLQLLILPLVGFLPPDDPRSSAPSTPSGNALARAGARLPVPGTRTAFPGGEGAFVICSFWLVEALAHLGWLDEAHESFTLIRSSATTSASLPNRSTRKPGSSSATSRRPSATLG